MPGKTHRVGPSLIDTAKAFATEENCHQYLEAARWPNGVTCLKCGNSKVSKFTIKGKLKEYANGEVKLTPDRFMYQCLNSVSTKRANISSRPQPARSSAIRTCR